MSVDIETICNQEETKSADKQEIENEERERMLNAENKSADEVQKQEPEQKEPPKSSEPIIEEGREVKPKFIPIGGIKMPGFFTRSKSKEKCKDLDDGAQGELLEKPDGSQVKESDDKESTPKKCRLRSLKIPNIFSSKPKPIPLNDDTPKDNDETNTMSNPGQKRGLLNAIRLPIANMIPPKFKLRSSNADPEAGMDRAKTAELASMETLDDNKDTEKPDIKNDDGMETVKLDIEEKTDEGDGADKLNWRERIRQQKFIIDDIAIAGGILLFIILLIIIIAIAASGSGRTVLFTPPLKDGQYVDAVTSCGYVEGILEDGAFAFRGIPYALPPVGENRWRVATPLNRIETCWNGTFKAHNATPPCIQIYGNGTIDGVEDCLTLDVITPEVRYDNPLPVVVLIGSNTLIGGSPGLLRPSTRYARSKDVIFVRPNFRVGILGFLSLNYLSQTSYPLTSGNYGLSDILMALRWIRLNIKHFGGDPKSVTVFGHRSGATLVTALLANKEAEKLFARAWVSSGSARYPDNPIEQSKEENNLFTKLLNCSDACLRKRDVRDILNAVPDVWRSVSPDLPVASENPNNTHEWLVVDGRIIVQNITTAIMESKIPLVIGTTAHESASAKLFKHEAWTAESVARHIGKSVIGDLKLTEEAVGRYNATYQGLSAMISDIRTVCPLLKLARLRPTIPFYIVTQGQGEHNIADVDSDISAILGRYEPKTPEQRRYVSAMQNMFYYYVWHGKVTQAEKSYSILTVGQDVLPSTEYPNCYYWQTKDVVPKYAKQD